MGNPIMQCFKRCAALLLAFILVPGIVVAVALVDAPRWLAAVDEPGPADAIIVLSGDYRRFYEGAKQFRMGRAPIVLGTREIRDRTAQMLEKDGIRFPEHEDIVRTILTKHGVKDDAIRFVGTNMVSTAHEATAIAAAFPEKGTRLLVVTSPYHVRRTKIILGEALPHAKLMVIANSFEAFPDAWWRDRALAHHIVLEFVKTVWFMAGGRFYRPEA